MMRRALRLYVGVTALVAAMFVLVAPWDVPSGESERFLNAFAALLLLGLLSEASSISLRLGSATSSVAFVPFLATVFVLGPPWAMLVGGSTFVVVETWIRRKSFIKVVFNTAKEVIALGTAGFAFTLLGGEPSTQVFQVQGVRDALPFFAAVVTYLAVGHTAVCRAVSLAEGIPFADAWSRIGGPSVGYDVFSSLLSPLLAYLYVEKQLAGVALLVVPLFIVRHLYHMFRELEQVNRELLELMVKSIEARDPYTSGHSQRVSRYARVIARETGLSAKAVEEVATAALLHDVGKIYEEFAVVLRKEGKLTPEERTLMQSHPAKSAELIATVSGLRGPVERAVRHHHEHYDGTGYPDGLGGEDIPIAGRIIMIADTLDAMTTDRPYRRALPFDEVVDELIRHRGRQFDPALVEVVIHSQALRVMLAERPQVQESVSVRPVFRALVAGRQFLSRRPRVSGLDSF